MDGDAMKPGPYQTLNCQRLAVKWGWRLADENHRCGFHPFMIASVLAGGCGIRVILSRPTKQCTDGEKKHLAIPRLCRSVRSGLDRLHTLRIDPRCLSPSSLLPLVDSLCSCRISREVGLNG